MNFASTPKKIAFGAKGFCQCISWRILPGKRRGARAVETRPRGVHRAARPRRRLWRQYDARATAFTIQSTRKRKALIVVVSWKDRCAYIGVSRAEHARHACRRTALYRSKEWRVDMVIIMRQDFSPDSFENLRGKIPRTIDKQSINLQNRDWKKYEISGLIRDHYIIFDSLNRFPYYV